MSAPSSAARSALFTLEDAKIAFNIFCCICGIGSLGMPSNYARAGWGYATVALLFMAFSNIYATVLLSKVLMVAPSSVKTYGDLGEWVAGKWGRFLVVVSHMGEKMSYLAASSPAVAALDLESNTLAAQDQFSVRESTTKNEDDLSEYKGSGNVVRYVLVRIALIAILTVASILLKDNFLDLVDFTGATAITVCSLILPLVFYVKVFWRKIPMWEKAICITISTVCAVVGCYVMIYAGKNLFNPDDDTATFPYCSAEYQDEPYYVRNSTASN
ncbi:hypothetical protein JG688_00016551 [Phytophthora aleatoria]|uniref:Amino acid transporter transmembrane domain-containing protein n=1 Tax=Phytophthora aleatoria TaxID=2496075 RepID=A0A8J5IC73_9STRA|nr:hypothetical protein JG688_00016551 [Phytophthora aleatoria]